MGHSMQLDESERTASAVGSSYRLADAVTGFADKPTDLAHVAAAEHKQLMRHLPQRRIKRGGQAACPSTPAREVDTLRWVFKRPKRSGNGAQDRPCVLLGREVRSAA